MRYPVLCMTLAVILFSGCQDLLRGDPPQPVEAVGPQTKEEVLNEIRPSISPIRNALTGASHGVSDQQRYMIMENLKDAVIQYGDEEFGRDALRELGHELRELATRAADAEHYQLVMTCIDAAEILAVDSQLLRRLGSKADVMLDKPNVLVKGFVDDVEKDQTYVFLEIINHRQGTVERMQARPGDEFNNLRLIRIIGRNKAVLFEYLKVPGLFFEVASFRAG